MQPVKAQAVTKETTAEFFNRVYSDVFLYTSKYALENNLHDMEATLRSYTMIEASNEAAEVQSNFRDTVNEQRTDYIVALAKKLNELESRYKDSLSTLDLDTILTNKLVLQEFLLTNDTHINFGDSVLDQVFAPAFLDLPDDDPKALELQIKKLRVAIQMAPEYDLGEIPTKLPTSGSISSPFGFRDDPFTNDNSWHSGLDIAAPTGTPVYAWFSGVVKNSEYVSGWGLQITTVQDSVMVRYAHLSQTLVKVGQRVTQGDLIGYVGSTGRSTGSHLHLGLYINNIAVDPYYIISRR